MFNEMDENNDGQIVRLNFKTMIFMDFRAVLYKNDEFQLILYWKMIWRDMHDMRFQEFEECE